VRAVEGEARKRIILGRAKQIRNKEQGRGLRMESQRKDDKIGIKVNVSSRVWWTGRGERTSKEGKKCRQKRKLQRKDASRGKRFKLRNAASVCLKLQLQKREGKAGKVE
jgi:hypothetical protein